MVQEEGQEKVVGANEHSAQCNRDCTFYGLHQSHGGKWKGHQFLARPLAAGPGTKKYSTDGVQVSMAEKHYDCPRNKGWQIEERAIADIATTQELTEFVHLGRLLQ
jgi:hypothetical protein